MEVRTYISRPTYFDKISPFIEKNIIKVITGQRRVGKSFFLFQLMDAIKNRENVPNIIYLNKELYEFDPIRDYEDLIAFVTAKSKDKTINYLFVDEIQDINKFEKALRHFFAKGNYDIYCTGSNAVMLSGELATYLSGRYIETRIFSLSYPEFLIFHNLEDKPESFKYYIVYGGLPYLKNLALEDLIVFDYLKSICSTILYKDVIIKNEIRNAPFLENLVKYLADNIGNIFSANKISEFLKSQRLQISPSIIQAYLGYLENAFLITKVKRNDLAGKRVFEVGEKYYFEDLGIRNSIISYQAKDIGKILENVVFQHLQFCGYKVSIGQLKDKEIDFIAEKNGIRIYIQVTYMITDESTRAREFGNLLVIKDNYRKMVISMDEITGVPYLGVEHWNIRKFLVEFC
jgi:uncharacterized protein